MQILGGTIGKKGDASPVYDSDLAFELFGEALALGEDTFAGIKTKSQIAQHNKFAVAKGYIVTKAAASDDGNPEAVFAEAITDVVVSHADVTLVWERDVTFVRDGYTLDVSITTFFAIDVPRWDGDVTITFGQDASLDIDGHLPRRAAKFLDRNFGDILDIDGNTATAEFSVKALGENTFAQVDLNILTLEDQLSEASIFVVAEIA